MPYILVEKTKICILLYIYIIFGLIFKVIKEGFMT